MKNIGNPSSEVRALIDKENELINHRITWLTTVQGLLFASLGFAWDKPTGERLIEVLCLLGIAISIIQLFALISSTIAIERLSLWWEIHKPKSYDGPGVIGFPRMKYRIFHYIVFWNWIPILFITAWAIIWFIVTG